MIRAAANKARCAAPWIIVPLVLPALTGCARDDATSATGSSAAAPAKLAKTTLEVDGMTCASCDVTVSVAAKKVDGVTDARASNEKKRAWVTYDADKTNPAAIAAAITKAGYPAKPIAAAGGG